MVPPHWMWDADGFRGRRWQRARCGHGLRGAGEQGCLGALAPYLPSIIGRTDGLFAKVCAVCIYLPATHPACGESWTDPLQPTSMSFSRTASTR